MKCRVCRAPAVIEVRRHNAAFCQDCFLGHCRNQVQRAIDEHHMTVPTERVLVAVSGGKDSLALWDILLGFGYQADGLYIGLGIGGYSGPSGEYARRFASERGARLVEVDLPEDYGYDVRSGAAADHRVPCSACGLSKRHIFDRSALDGGYDVVATGHNLDDEAAVLLGNVLRWDLAYLARQRPVLPGVNGFPRKVKPLVRLGERETAAYCVLRGIDYQVEECPMSVGNKHLGYKDALNAIEERSPGTKAAFYNSFLERGSQLVAHVGEEDREGLHPCASCGAPTTGSVCAFCRLVERAGARRHGTPPAGTPTAGTPTAGAQADVAPAVTAQ
jgi:tRNA-5-methyluridine54 2-sulfurtransferase